MVKRIIYIGSPAYISSENEQVVITNKQDGSVNTVPSEDIGVLEIDNPQVTITSNCMKKLMQSNAAILFCNEQHVPTGLCLPLDGNCIQTERFLSQVESKVPLRKQLWQQTVRAKIRNQCLLLEKYDKPFKTLKEKIDKVKSGDSGNQEGSASAYYWKTIFQGIKFKRDRFGEYPNNMLNYGYMVLRAIVARAVVSAGLHPSMGIFHKNKYNPYCLADDIMEPYRPFVDEIVLNYFDKNEPVEILGKDQKKLLLGISTIDTEIADVKHPLMESVRISCSSLCKCYSGEIKNLSYPIICGSALTE